MSIELVAVVPYRASMWMVYFLPDLSYRLTSRSSSCVRLTLKHTNQTHQIHALFRFYATIPQLVVLQLSLGVFEDPYCGAVTDRMHPSYETSQRRSALMLGTYLRTIARLLCSIDLESAIFMQLTTLMPFSPQSSIPITIASGDEIDEKDRLLQRELRIDFIHLGIQVIASGLSFISDDDDATTENDNRSSVKDVLVLETAILSQLIRVLKGRDASTRKLRASIDCSSVDDDARVKDIMRYTLQLLGNLVHRCFTAQVVIHASSVNGL